MIRVFRPFWSYDVKKTEEWLSAMAERGYILVKVNRWLRYFYFQKIESQTKTYRVVYDKIEASSQPKSLTDEGWIKVLQCGKWQFISNDKPIEHLKTYTVREGIIKRNKMIMYTYSGILIYFLFIALMNLSIFGVALFQDEPVVVEKSPLWIITFTCLAIAIALFIIAIYSVFKIRKTNKILLSEKHEKLPNEVYSENRLTKKEEKQLKFSGSMIVKRKFGWMYAPDQLEKWLVNMEELGFNLYRVGKTGTVFYFIKGEPRKVSYCADYQNISNEGYFDIHKEAGWKNIFTSYSSIQKWTIWSREYQKGEVSPRIYSDKIHLLKHAKKVAVSYTSWTIPLIIMYIYIFIQDLNNLSYFHPKGIILNMVLFLVVALLFGINTVRTWFYFLRLRKQ
ncbi:DUF2812 domain-containing protein [Arthrobacter citreus]|nr:DUF2812 domain-containing protein [Arthrobacter citreus]